jgi:hypothetical protein
MEKEDSVEQVQKILTSIVKQKRPNRTEEKQDDTKSMVQFKDDNDVFLFDETVPSTDHYIPGIHR